MCVVILCQPGHTYLNPVSDIEKGLFVGQIEDEDEAHGVSVEGGGERPEALLARRVPQL